VLLAKLRYCRLQFVMLTILPLCVTQPVGMATLLKNIHSLASMPIPLTLHLDTLQSVTLPSSLLAIRRVLIYGRAHFLQTRIFAGGGVFMFMLSAGMCVPVRLASRTSTTRCSRTMWSLSGVTTLPMGAGRPSWHMRTRNRWGKLLVRLHEIIVPSGCRAAGLEVFTEHDGSCPPQPL